MSPRPTTFLFDIGGTLVFPNWRLLSDELAREGLDITPDRLAAREPFARRAIDSAQLIGTTNDATRWGEYFDRIVRECDVPGLPAAALARIRAYHEARNLWEHVPAEVPALLEQLRGRFRLGAVSNANGTVRRKLEELGLAAHFEVIVDSAVVGIEKPDPRIFRLALDHMGVMAGDAAYVGDIYHVDIVGARAAGLRPILLDPCGLHADKDCERITALQELFAIAGPRAD